MTHPNNATHQAAHRARVLARGLKEVRSCYAHPADHAAIKAYAAKLGAKRAKLRDWAA